MADCVAQLEHVACLPDCEGSNMSVSILMGLEKCGMSDADTKS